MNPEPSSLMLIYVKEWWRSLYLFLSITSSSSQTIRCLSFSRLFNSLLFLDLVVALGLLALDLLDYLAGAFLVLVMATAMKSDEMIWIGMCVLGVGGIR